MGTNQWTCCGQPFTQAEIVEHLKTVHQIASPITGTRRMVRHIDGREFYQSNYEWKVGELVLTQVVRNERDADDPMRGE